MPAPTHPSDPPGHRIGSAAYHRITLALFLAGLATFALLYATQPLLPLLSTDFGVSPAQSAWSVSFATAGLGTALLLAGPLSEVWGRTRLMHASLLLSGLVALACGFAPSWASLLGLRAVEGVALAGLPAVAMAYLAEEIDPADSARAAGLYVAGTAIGGMSGRLLAGGLSELFGWRPALVGIGVLGLGCAVAVRALLPESRRFHPKPARLGQLLSSTRGLLADPAMWCLFGIAGCAMGAFVGAFNALGFRLEAPPYALGVGVAGLVYLSYTLGSVTSAWAGRAAATLGHRTVEPLLLLAMLLGLLLTLAEPLPIVVLGVAILTGGFFGAHGVASGWVASRASLSTGTPGQASSLYLFAYYLGSSVAGSLAGTAWSAGGWPGVVVLTGGLVVLAIGYALALRRIPSLLEPPEPDPGIVCY